MPSNPESPNKIVYPQEVLESRRRLQRVVEDIRNLLEKALKADLFPCEEEVSRRFNELEKILIANEGHISRNTLEAISSLSQEFVRAGVITLRLAYYLHRAFELCEKGLVQPKKNIESSMETNVVPITSAIPSDSLLNG